MHAAAGPPGTLRCCAVGYARLRDRSSLTGQWEKD